MTRLLHFSAPPHPTVITLASRSTLRGDPDDDRLVVRAGTRHVGGNLVPAAQRPGSPGTAPYRGVRKRLRCRHTRPRLPAPTARHRHEPQEHRPSSAETVTACT